MSPDTGNVIELFHPRKQNWQDHFSLIGSEIVGISDIGRATVQLLDMNEEERVAVRAQLLEERAFSLFFPFMSIRQIRGFSSFPPARE